MDWLLASRRRVVLITIGILLLLDLGRSVYARVGYAEPAESWQEAPYEAIVWPPGAGNLPPEPTLGEQVYVERCAVCHGPEGEGNGPGAPSMIPRPRDFTLGEFKYTSTPAGEPPTDEDLFQVVADGLHASGMPYFDDLLSVQEITAVITYVKSLSPAFDEPPPATILVPERVPADEASVDRGQTLYQENGCGECHGEDLRGNIILQDSRGYPVRSRDLTAPWTFRGGARPEQIWLRLTTGMPPGPMPAHEDTMTATERWHVVNYILSESRLPPWEPGGVLDGPGLEEDPVKRGEYLLHAQMCGMCHTQVSPDMRYSRDDYFMAGGMAVPLYPQGVFVSRNLTPDPETGIGEWTTEQIADALRNGRTPERTLNLFAMPWMYLHSFSEEDALAMGTYLKTLPPVNNKIPQPLRYGVVERIVGKTLYSDSIPPLGTPHAFTYKHGNYGHTEPTFLPRHWTQTVLIAAQWLVLTIGSVAFLVAAPPERRWPEGKRGWLKTGLVLFGLLVLVVVGWVMARTPVLNFIPPEQVNQTVVADIPTPDPVQFESEEEAALAERGHYLFTVTPCAFCHGNDGSGGFKISARHGFGTTWVANITSHPETGIGNWSDAEIARAIRSGISRDGRQFHWQAMIWDFLSNLSEEDVRALIVYLRTLPPIENEVPTPSPPSPADCEEYTYYLESGNEPGCE